MIKSSNKKQRLSGKQPEVGGSPVKKKRSMSTKDELIRRYPVQCNASMPAEDTLRNEQHMKAIEDELKKAKPRNAVLLPLLKLTYPDRRMYVQNVATSVADILTKHKALSRPAVVSLLYVCIVLVMQTVLFTLCPCVSVCFMICFGIPFHK